MTGALQHFSYKNIEYRLKREAYKLRGQSFLQAIPTLFTLTSDKSEKTFRF